MVRSLLGVVLVVALGLVASDVGAQTLWDPRVTRVRIRKRAHSMELLAAVDGTHEKRIAKYRVAIGPGGAGPKVREGDDTTPVGRYHVTMRKSSRYRIFMRLDYPNEVDLRRFESLKKRGILPESARIGGDIGIHGPPVRMNDDEKAHLKESDWTAGCIALDDDEIREVARLVWDGTVVDIED
ncbi:ErfK/YbiS/YcfS/YnhG family protein [Labilithrix luteola]|uniref:ErfK/YbiS/YcfS/YnhG family protein n=1 Tax=Labilithrix luteola TaxID=1391654 RepID=A0A0K1PVP6_9BACT|nr:L,D-transpeptidase family protein [Labilithrix luteola]AKU97597.1 ErfK/YbiS/YcfS/YnhG family protein [Labilithrix luteola]